MYRGASPPTQQKLHRVKRHSLYIYVCALVAMTALFTACSTKKNTAGTRFWQAFTTRYNVYFNGNEAYKEGLLAQEEGNKDNYTELLPVFTVGNEQTRSLGKSNFETAVTKCEKAIQLHSIKKRPIVSSNKRRSAKMKAYLKRQEFNPFLKNAWLLMGRAQFQKGEFMEAASTFSYITRHYAQEPEVVSEARVWLARCYAEQDWFYDAEDALDKTRRDTLSRSVARERTATQTDLLLRQGRLEEALPYLRTAARQASRKMQRARLYFLLGQVEKQLGHAEASYKAFRRCLRTSPPYEMAFNARIAQTEVLANGKNAKKMKSRLRRMARNENNKQYLDQVYYALGNIYLSERDTMGAISAYEQGRTKATRSGIEKGILLLKLGEVYWDKGKYDKAQTCYAEAVGLIDKTRKDYEFVMRRSKVLDALVPYTSAVQLQDSLLVLSTLPEADRNAAIDRVIEELKRKEKEEARAKADSVANALKGQGDANAAATNKTTTTTSSSQNKAWYFYNPLSVSEGKQSFRKLWGQRKNEDNWRRSNRTVLAIAGDDEEYNYDEEETAEATDSATTDTTAVALEDSVGNDPHTREYYLKQIPFTEEAKAEAHAIIQDGLYNAGIIEKDQLEDFPLAARTLGRLTTEYPDYEKCDDALYQLFLLYSRTGNTAEAERYRSLLASRFPESEAARLITDPDYELYARYGKQIEDSLYTATYAAYRQRDNVTVQRNFEVSTNKFPSGANRPKFIFVHALSRIGRDSDSDIADELRELVKKFPESDVSEMAGMIVKGLESGRQFTSGTYDIGSLWSRRTSTANAAVDEAGKMRQLTGERDVPFIVIVAYPTDSLDDGRVLYDLAHYNFTGFVVRNFDITKQREADITQFRIAGFNSFEEAHTYAQQLYADSAMAVSLAGARLVIISATNTELLGTTYSFDDYAKFYDKTFAPVKLNPQLPLDMQDMPVEQHYEDEYTPEELQQLEDEKGTSGSSTDDTDSDTDDDGGEWYTPD